MNKFFMLGPVFILSSYPEVAVTRKEFSMITLGSFLSGIIKPIRRFY
jgi:hypothetical protein